MKAAITVVLLLAVALPATAQLGFTTGNDYFIRLKASFYCHGKPVTADVDILEADYFEFSHDRITSFKDHAVDATIATSDPSIGDPDDHLEIFLRIHYDCGCAPYYDTKTSPDQYQFLDRFRAQQHPWILGKVELSDCDAQRKH